MNKRKITACFLLAIGIITVFIFFVFRSKKSTEAVLPKDNNFYGSQDIKDTSNSPEKNSSGGTTNNNSTRTPDSQASNSVSAAPAPTSSAPKKAVDDKGVLAFATYYYDADKSSYNSLVTNYSSIAEMATQTFVIDKQGGLSGLVPKEQIRFAKSKGIKVYAMITNNFDPTIVQPVLEDPKKRSLLISNILNRLQTYGYNGLSVDIEGIYSSDRKYLSLFMKELYSKLKPKGYTITISVPAKTYDNPKAPWNGAYDYKELGAYSDEVILMTYDEHFDKAGPIASINWVKSVVNFALTKIPAEKIRFGVAAYGYDWSSKGRKALSISGTYKLAKQYGAEIKWDSVSQSPHFDYMDSSGVKHNVWLENAESLSFKLDIVKAKALKGIAIWRIGLEDSSYWNKIKSNLK